MRKRKRVRLVDCKYVDGVGCNPDESNCEKCGWNPVVLKRREAKIMRVHHMERCVCCGAIIPEGRQVCLTCEGVRQGEGS